MYCPECGSLLSHSGSTIIDGVPHNYTVYSCGTYIVNRDTLQSEKCSYLQDKKRVEQLVQNSSNKSHELFDFLLHTIVA